MCRICKIKLINSIELLGPNLSELISQRDEDGYSALHCAAYSNSFDVSILLLQNGGNVNGRTNDGWTPLHSAARWNSDSVASLLLSFGADVNAKTNGSLTPIQLAVSEKGYMKAWGFTIVFSQKIENLT